MTNITYDIYIQEKMASEYRKIEKYFHTHGIVCDSIKYLSARYSFCTSNITTIFLTSAPPTREESLVSLSLLNVLHSEPTSMTLKKQTN